MVVHSKLSKVGHHVLSDGVLERRRKLCVILYPERSATNECSVQSKLYHRNYRRPMLRNIGRLHRSTDASNVPFIGEASYDVAISGGKGTQVL